VHPLHALQISLPSSKPVRPQSEPRSDGMPSRLPGQHNRPERLVKLPGATSDHIGLSL